MMMKMKVIISRSFEVFFSNKFTIIALIVCKIIVKASLSLQLLSN